MNRPNPEQSFKAKAIVAVLLLVLVIVVSTDSLLLIALYNIIVWAIGITMWRRRYIRWKQDRANRRGGPQ
jgi:Flp pilus assembly protein TadB